MGTNASFQSMDTLRNGLNLFNDATGLLGDRSSEARAGLIETEAAGDARDIRRQAGQEAAEFREAREQARGASNADWGGSNLAMSGSKAVIRDAERFRDRQDEEDILFEGEQEARSRLGFARDRADALRIDEGVSTERSLLSLGSKIYGRNRA